MYLIAESGTRVLINNLIVLCCSIMMSAYSTLLNYTTYNITGELYLSATPRSAHFRCWEGPRLGQGRC